MSVVKGITKRVVVVKPTDKRLFEEAIFIIRGDALGDIKFSSEDLVREACIIADNHVKANSVKSRLFTGFSAAGLLFAGAGVTGLIWFLTTLG